MSTCGIPCSRKTRGESDGRMQMPLTSCMKTAEFLATGRLLQVTGQAIAMQSDPAQRKLQIGAVRDVWLRLIDIC